MSDQEFVAPVAPSLGEAPDVAPQGGASVMPSQAEGGQQAQIATPPPPPAPTRTDWTQDPEYRKFQSEMDKLKAQNNRLQQQMEQTQRDNQMRLRQMEESDFRRQYENEWNAAPPERKAQVEQKYRDLKAQRDMQAQSSELETLRAAQAVSDLRFDALRAGVPVEVIEQELAEAGNDPRVQANAMIRLPYKWLQFQQSQRQPQPQVPQYAPPPPYGQQPVYQQPAQYQQPVQAQPPVQAPPPVPQEPLRQPATPVARPGTVTPAEQRAWSLRNQAMDSGDWKAYDEYKRRMVREARNAAAGR